MVALPFCRRTLTVAKPKDSSYPAALSTLGDHLRSRRLDLGLLQKDVAAQIICTVDTITNWELNRCQPELEYIPRIIAFLGYDPTVSQRAESLGEGIRLKRRRLGLSLKELGARLGTDESNLWGWETGRHNPTRRSLALIESFLTGQAVSGEDIA
jgi:transcriptional regulator with XRE-family HTH domain